MNKHRVIVNLITTLNLPDDEVEYLEDQLKRVNWEALNIILRSIKRIKGHHENIRA